MEIWGFGDLEVWRFGGLEILRFWRFGDLEIWRFGGLEMKSDGRRLRCDTDQWLLRQIRGFVKGAEFMEQQGPDHAPFFDLLSAVE